MHTIEPYYNWRDYYTVEDDERLPFYQKEYNEFEFTDYIYNYYIHPQWDYFGSKTMYLKIIYVDYHEGYAFIQILGEWNDSIENDIMTLKRNIIDELFNLGVNKIFFIADNLMNMFYDDDDYYDEIADDLITSGGYVVMINFPEHLFQEIQGTAMRREFFYDFIPEWRKYKPDDLYRKFANRLQIGSPSE